AGRCRRLGLTPRPGVSIAGPLNPGRWKVTAFPRQVVRRTDHGRPTILAVGDVGGPVGVDGVRALVRAPLPAAAVLRTRPALLLCPVPAGRLRRAGADLEPALHLRAALSRHVTTRAPWWRSYQRRRAASPWRSECRATARVR